MTAREPNELERAPVSPTLRECERGPDPSTPLLELKDVHCAFDVSPPWLNRLLERTPRRWLRAVNGVSFTIDRGTTYALVGESGCGKSTIARLIVGLYRPSRGEIRYRGRAIERAGAGPAAHTRDSVQMIFQDPYASLNPRWRVFDIVAEPIRTHEPKTTKTTLVSRVTALLTQVGLSESDSVRYPHQFSGGQRQRVSIARALASNPALLVCDEPTSALDVSVQAQVLNLMRRLQRERELTYLFISHNLAVVHHVADRVGVMYMGRIVEEGSTRALFSEPLHPYTRMLLEAVPDVRTPGKARTAVRGEVPNPLAPPSGCTFHPRCPHANVRCREELPQLRRAREDALVACHAVEEGRLAPMTIVVMSH